MAKGSKKTVKIEEDDFDLFDDETTEDFDLDETDDEDLEEDDFESEEDEDFDDEDLDEAIDTVDQSVETEKFQALIETGFQNLSELVGNISSALQALSSKLDKLNAAPAAKPEKKAAPDAAVAEESSEEVAPKRRGRPAGAKNKAKEEAPAASKVKKADAAFILAQVKSKPRKGTEAIKLANVLSKKKFNGSLSPEEIVSHLQEEGLVKKDGTFK